MTVERAGFTTSRHERKNDMETLTKPLDDLEAALDRFTEAVANFIGKHDGLIDVLKDKQKFKLAMRLIHIHNVVSAHIGDLEGW
jgi:hypothetical protein